MTGSVAQRTGVVTPLSSEVEELGDGARTPSIFVANNIGVALAIPAAVIAHLIVFRQRRRPARQLRRVQRRRLRRASSQDHNATHAVAEHRAAPRVLTG